MLPVLCAFAISLIAALAPAANQKIADSELQRFITQGRYPSGCSESTIAANTLKAKPTTDAAQLRLAAGTFHACATSPYGVASFSLRNAANFSAAAALLLAARHDDPASARKEAESARTLAQSIVTFTNPSGASGKSRPPDPSPYITDAGRISRDADALIASLTPPATKPT
jgi:hypothetical protein